MKSCCPPPLPENQLPNFAPNFTPNFLRIFRGLFELRFVGDGDQKKFTKNPRHFSMQNSQANTKKIFTKFFWRAGEVGFRLWHVAVGWGLEGWGLGLTDLA